MMRLRLSLAVCGLTLATVALAAPKPRLTFVRERSGSCRLAERGLVSFEKRSLAVCGQASGCTVKTRRRHDMLARRAVDRCLALNQIQVLGSHNSYHIRPNEPLWSAVLALVPVFNELDYTHPALAEQFSDEGVRQIEIDVWADPPPGGLFAARDAQRVLGISEPKPPELFQPGFKVLHIQDVDFETRCVTFVECLQDVKTWSDGHPGHLPIAILIEAKDDVLPDVFGVHFTVPINIGSAQFDDLDAEIRSVFAPERLITPDDVRGKASTLESAVRTRGWPSLASARGRVLFLLDNSSKSDEYLDGHPGLAGRVLFTNSRPGRPDAAFVEVNDSFDDSIPGLVSQGYVVRTRADADTHEARSGDTAPRDAALASGAQWVSTDYAVPNPDFGTGYMVRIPDGMPGRCNPVNAPASCRNVALER